MRQWCSANNHRLAGPNWEVYGHWVDEWNTNPSRIRTDVYTCCQMDPASKSYRLAFAFAAVPLVQGLANVLRVPSVLGLRGS